MPQPLKRSEDSPGAADEAPRAAVEHRLAPPTESVDHGMERKPDSKTSLGQDIRARSNRPHKGDLGRRGSNEEVFQGSKQKELK